MIDPNKKISRVELTPPNPEWGMLYRTAVAELQSILKKNLLHIHHIGSTAIPDIYAKPIIDIVPVVADLNLVDALNAEFTALGYVCMGEYGIPGRRFYWKSKEKRTHNIHLFEQGAAEIARYIAFKEFMQQNPGYALGYSTIKRCLAYVFPEDIEQYVNGKSSYVQMIDYQTGYARLMQLNAIDEVVLAPYNAVWPKLATAEITAIKQLTTDLSPVTIEHIGSTAVVDLSSKPIIDIMIVVDSIDSAADWVMPLSHLGYVYWEENPDKTHLRFFKGMPPFGEKRTHHIHIVAANDETVKQRILFRDILRVNPIARMDYEALKKKLATCYPCDRELYTEGKADFITAVLNTYGYHKPLLR